VAALVVLVAGSVGTYAWALGHWFVGVDGKGGDEQVAVFRGLNVSVVGFDLYELEEDTGLVLADLEPAVRNRVRGGITADDPNDADRILDRLRAEQLPVCPTPEDDTSASAGATTSAPAGTPSRPAPAAGTSARPTATSGVPARTSAGPASLTTSAPRTPVTPATTTPTRTTSSPEPGVSCREED
jgi:hypothetical protein